MPKPITPTVGRILWYRPHDGWQPGIPHRKGEPLAALVTAVESDNRVNVLVLDANGGQHPMPSVLLVQPGDEAPAKGGYCEWMPFQIGQAEKTAEAERQLAERGEPATTIKTEKPLAR